MPSSTRHSSTRQDALVALGVGVVWTAIVWAAPRWGNWYPFRIDSYYWVGVWLAVPLALRRLAPGVGFWLTAVVFPVGYFMAADGSPIQSDFHALPMMIAAFAVTHARVLHPVLVGGVAVAVTSGLYLGWFGVTGVLSGAIAFEDPSRIMLLASLVIAATVLGTVVGRLVAASQSLEERNAQLRALQEVRARAAVRAERTRIARELHDVVAHHVTAIVVRAQAADRVGDDRPEEYRAAVRWIAPAGKEALSAMRSVVRVLRDVDGADEAADPAHTEPVPAGVPLAPLPGLADLSGVVERVRGAGLTLVADLPAVLPPCPPDVGLAVVRVAQEALTNVLMHSATGSADLTLATAPGALILEVRDPGPARHAPGTSDGGHGIVHMRERAAACGGTLAAGPTQDGHWVVRMEVPVP